MKETLIQYRFILAPLLTWFFIQLYKLIYDLITTKKCNFKRLLSQGGMPSSHSAVVMVLSVMIGKNYGFDSAIFALSLVFALVVIYDAMGVRRAAGKQAALLNKIMETPDFTHVETEGKLDEQLGHTPRQVFIGALIGVIVGILV